MILWNQYYKSRSIALLIRFFFFGYKGGFPGGSVVKNPPANAGDMGQEDPLKKEMATYSSILAWEIPWTEAAGGLQSMEFHKS